VTSTEHLGPGHGGGGADTKVAQGRNCLWQTDGSKLEIHPLQRGCPELYTILCMD